MDNTHKKPTRFMDFAPAKRRPVSPTAATAAKAAAVAPSATSATQPQVKPAQPTRPSRPQAIYPQPQAKPTRPAAIFRRPATAATDPLSARPVSRPASAAQSTSAAPSVRSTSAAPSVRPAAPRIVQSTTVKSVAATADRVESFEFGIIEDLSSIVQPEPPMIPGTRPAVAEQPSAQPQSPSAEQPKRHAAEKSPLFSRKAKSSSPAPRKSPFLSSVNVPKRPLSASAPTGVNVPTTSQAPAEPATRPPKKKRKNAPFIVIVILSVLLGVALGAIVYFVLPH